jgi:hypothetical protein
MKTWKDELWLLTEAELDSLPDGTILLSVNNNKKIKTDALDRDTRFGVLAYGLTEELADQQGLKNQFLLWMMES